MKKKKFKNEKKNLKIHKKNLFEKFEELGIFSLICFLYISIMIIFAQPEYFLDQKFQNFILIMKILSIFMYSIKF